MTDCCVVLVTFPDEKAAARVASAMVKSRLAACANLLPQARSIYSWEGKLCDEPEVVAIFKTRGSLFERLRAAIVAVHPYQCPEVLRLPVEAGHRPYLEWVRTSTIAPATQARSRGASRARPA